jgi:prophage tail gpP-like protein
MFEKKPPEVTLKCNGRKLGGWTTVSIRKSLEQLAHEFSLEVTNQSVGPLGQPIHTGVDVITPRTMADELTDADECTIYIDDQLVITGYVDDFNFNHNAQASTLTVSGFSKTGDLTACSAIYGNGVWTDATIATIANNLCQPYGISVVAFGSSALTPLKRFKIEQGETVHDAIARAAEMRSLLLVTNAQGNLDLLNASTGDAVAILQLGGNILAGGVTRTSRDRHSQYIFKGQTSASDEWSGKQASQLQGSITDPDVLRHRPLIVLSEKQRTKEDLGKRAIWERNVRAGRSVRYRATVEEWTADSGALWEPNISATIQDEWCQVDQAMLCVSAELVLDQRERVTHLDFMDRSAFDPEPWVKPPVKRGKRRFGGL